MLAYVWRGRATQKQACQNRLAAPRKQKKPATRTVANFGEGGHVRFESIASCLTKSGVPPTADPHASLEIDVLGHVRKKPRASGEPDKINHAAQPAY
jgi:hypothetical protein